MKEKVLKGIIVIGTLITLVMSNLIFVGTNIVYALYEELEAQGVNTNNKNIQFDAYFKDEAGNKIHSITRNIKDNGVLYINLTVKNAGVLNDAIIKIRNANFVLDNVENNHIKSINTQNNEIYLNSIVYGNNVEIGIPIKFQKTDTIILDLFNMENIISLSGNYKNDDTDSKLVTGEVKTRILWTEDVNMLLEQSIEKYVQLEEKVILQTKIISEIENNVLPKQSEVITTKIPEIEGNKPQEINILMNGRKISNYTVDEATRILTINMENKANNANEVNWKSGKDEYKIVYIFAKEAYKNGANINIETEAVTKVYTKDSITKNIQKQEEVTLKGDIVSNDVTSTKNLYKGYMYAKVENETLYQENMKVEISDANSTNEIVIQNVSDLFVNSNNVKLSTQRSVIYKSTKINKQDILDVLGNEGSITIYKNGTEEVSKINKDTQANEQGYVVIDYTDTNTIKIVTTKPEKEGTIDIINQKAIKGDTGYTRQQLKSINFLESKIETASNTGKEESTQTVELMDTTTNATLQLSKESLSTVVSNDVEMRAILVSDNEQKDLYKNPIFRIDLPEEVVSIENLNVSLLYETELKVKKAIVEGKSIYIELEGEQTSYKTQVVEGTNIVIQARITLDRTAGSKDQVIKMIYVNENASEKQKEEQVNVKIVAPKDVIPVQSINELGIATIGETEEETVNIERGSSKKELEATIEIINNNSEMIENVKVVGDLLTNNKENNLGIKIIQGIELENADVYYTENENATDDIQNTQNGWNQKLTEKSVKYLIVIGQMPAQSSIITNYKFEIPANLEYNQSAKTSYVVDYQNTLSGRRSKAESTMIALETGIGPEAKVSVNANIGGETINDNQKVKNGEVISYNIKVSNTGSEDMNDIFVSAKIPEGTTLVEPNDNTEGEPEERYEYNVLPYYREVNAEKFEGKISFLKVGEEKTVTFEVRVNSNTEEGKEIIANAEIKYGDVTKQSNMFKAIAEKGSIRVSVKRGTDRTIPLYPAGTVYYHAIVENPSGEKQENVKVKANFSESVEIQKLVLISGVEKFAENLDYGELKATEIENQDEINMGSFEPGEIKAIQYIMKANKTENPQVKFLVKAITSKEECRSNCWKEEMRIYKVSMGMSVNTTSKYLKSGDIVEYTITANNESEIDISGLNIKNSIPKQLTIKNITKNGEKVNEIEKNDFVISVDIPKGEKSIIKIETVVNYSDSRYTAETIINRAEAEMRGEVIATTEEIVHIIEANETTDNPDNPGTDDPNNNDIPDNNLADGDKMISGMAWLDNNKDGKKDSDEKVFDNIKVRLLNADTQKLVKDKDGKILEAYTDSNGMYVLDKIGNGNYIVIFDYDTTQYTVTKYCVTGISEDKNSNAMINELMIQGNKQSMASTDIISLKNANISNVNLGLVELEIFDLQLDKYVSKIIVQNKQGTIVKEYVNTTLAKHEIDAKFINGTNVMIEYKIKVSNVGELEGTANKIVDYMPKDLKFSSELNKDWYQIGDKLYNESISDEKIPAGESKTLTLTLTKAMTENNVGAVYNTAEIIEDYNDLGIADINSIPGNGIQGENDLGSADVILSIRTGGTILFIIVVTVATIGMCVAIVLIIRQKKLIDKM